MRPVVKKLQWSSLRLGLRTAVSTGDDAALSSDVGGSSADGSGGGGASPTGSSARAPRADKETAAQSAPPQIQAAGCRAKVPPFSALRPLGSDGGPRRL